jgi:hypothetical protein
MFLKRSFGLDIECLLTMFTITVQKHRSRTVFGRFCSPTPFALVCTQHKRNTSLVEYVNVPADCISSWGTDLDKLEVMVHLISTTVSEPVTVAARSETAGMQGPRVLILREVWTCACGFLSYTTDVLRRADTPVQSTKCWKAGSNLYKSPRHKRNLPPPPQQVKMD